MDAKQKLERKIERIGDAMEIDEISEVIIREICEELQLPINLVRSIFIPQFRSVAKTIRSGSIEDIETYKNIRLPNFGLFHFRKYRYEKTFEESKDKRRKFKYIRNIYKHVGSKQTGSDNS
jgi:hypothetical protein